MNTRNYLLLCAALSVAVVIVVAYVPGVAGYLEQHLLTFLSTHARG